MPFQFSPILDTEFLQALYEDDFAYAEEVFANFLQQTNHEIELLQQLEQAGSLPPFRAQLHKIKPTFSLVGLSNLTGESEKLLALCDKSGDMNEVRPSYYLWQSQVSEWLPQAELEYQRLKSYNQSV